ncbi:MAG: carbon storage regulator [Planctomycetota bacterium]|jgi:carbon storage regulator
MLVLTRKKWDEIVIHGDIIITVLATGHEKVKLGIEAPRHVPVHRREVYEAAKACKVPRDVSTAAGPSNCSTSLSST